MAFQYVDSDVVKGKSIYCSAVKAAFNKKKYSLPLSSIRRNLLWDCWEELQNESKRSSGEEEGRVPQVKGRDKYIKYTIIPISSGFCCIIDVFSGIVSVVPVFYSCPWPELVSYQLRARLPFRRNTTQRWLWRLKRRTPSWIEGQYGSSDL